jgi:hypothetical protein
MGAVVTHLKGAKQGIWYTVAGVALASGVGIWCLAVWLMAARGASATAPPKPNTSISGNALAIGDGPIANVGTDNKATTNVHRQ